MKFTTLIFAVIGAFLLYTPVLADTTVALTYDETNFPHFHTNHDDFPDEARALERTKQAFRDMLMMFRVACVSHNPDTDIYDRYFEEDIDNGSKLFLSIVCEAAGIKIEDRKDWDVQRALKDEGPVSEKYKHWEVWAGKADSIPEDHRPALDDAVTATTYQDIDDLPGKGVEDAITELYLRAFDFPKLSDVKDHRGLAGLGSKDSGLMTTLGAQLVHEAVHWRYLCINIDGTNAADFNRIVKHTVIFEDGEKEDLYEIDDYSASDPKWREDPELEPDDGYGPVHAHTLVVNEQGDSYRNADNYRWYIVSLYWKAVFEKEFEQQDDNNFSDKIVPKGTAGQVPFPGEKPPTRFVGRFARVS